VNLRVAASQMTAVLDRSSHDPLYGTTSAAYRGAFTSLTWWVEKGRRIVASTEEAVARLVKAEKRTSPKCWRA
jgi:streptomycin 6-kinase